MISSPDKLVLGVSLMGDSTADKDAMVIHDKLRLQYPKYTQGAIGMFFEAKRLGENQRTLDFLRQKALKALL